MSVDYGNLCSVIIKQCFGETVQCVADCLYKVVSALAVLIKFRLVEFQPAEFNNSVAEYTLLRDEILYILRYSRYVHLLQGKYGAVGATIGEEVLHAGSQTQTSILFKCITSADNKEKLETYRNTFNTMVTDNYLIRAPELALNEDGLPDVVPKLNLKPYELFSPTDVSLRSIMDIQAGTLRLQDAQDAGIFWQMNYKRFHQDFRDAIMIAAIERKLGPSTSECVKYILKLMYDSTDPWERQTSNPFTLAELKHMIDKQSNNLDLIKNLDQYFPFIADDVIGYLRKTGEMGGGQYVVDLSRTFETLAFIAIEHIITERFGSKASRIFRIIRLKKFIEQEDLQKDAMVPAKESKLLSYGLFQQQFLHIKTIRKAGGGGSGPAKAFYLFHVKDKQVVKMLLDICYKSLYNDITRSNYEKAENKRLIDKSQKLESIVAAMKERGESDEYIAEILETLTPPEREILENVKSRIKTLSKAELTLDDTIFLFQMYLHHNMPAVYSVAKK